MGNPTRRRYPDLLIHSAIKAVLAGERYAPGGGDDGIGQFIGAWALACWRITRRVLTARLAILAGTLVVVGLLADADPLWPLTAVAAGLLAIVVTEDLTIHRETAADIAFD